MSRDGYIDTLRHVTLFSGCSDAELRMIAGLTTDIQLPADKELCAEGRPGEEFFVLVDGQVKVEVAGKEIATVGPGGYVGELALLDAGPRLATVTTTKPTRVLVLSRREFNSLLDDSPSVTRQILHGIGRRLRESRAAASS